MKKIKLFDPTIGKQEEIAIKKILRSKFWASGAGIGNVAKFETALTNYVGAKDCVALNSGTAALHLALSMIDIKNKEVILPSLSFVSTAHAIVYNGGIPKFIDIDPETMCLDHNLVEKEITDKTSVILPVHFGGMPCNLKKLSSICKKNNILLIEDAAHAAGSSFGGKKIGSHGDYVCFSFHPVKNLSMPTGGAITINSGNIIKSSKILKSKRWCGITNRNGLYYDVKEIGWNFYMNEFSAAIGIQQLKKLDKLNQRRNNIAKRYSTELSIENKMPFSSDCSYHLYWILINNRDRFIKKMFELGIEIGVHYIPITQMTLYKGRYNLPNTDRAGKQIVSIPIHANLSDNDVSYIIKSINKLS